MGILVYQPTSIFAGLPFTGSFMPGFLSIGAAFSGDGFGRELTEDPVTQEAVPVEEIAIPSLEQRLDAMLLPTSGIGAVVSSHSTVQPALLFPMPSLVYPAMLSFYTSMVNSPLSNLEEDAFSTAYFSNSVSYAPKTQSQFYQRALPATLTFDYDNPGYLWQHALQSQDRAVLPSYARPSFSLDSQIQSFALPFTFSEPLFYSSSHLIAPVYQPTLTFDFTLPLEPTPVLPLHSPEEIPLTPFTLPVTIQTYLPSEIPTPQPTPLLIPVVREYQFPLVTEILTPEFTLHAQQPREITTTLENRLPQTQTPILYFLLEQTSPLKESVPAPFSQLPSKPIDYPPAESLLISAPPTTATPEAVTTRYSPFPLQVAPSQEIQISPNERFTPYAQHIVSNTLEASLLTTNDSNTLEAVFEPLAKPKILEFKTIDFSAEKQATFKELYKSLEVVAQAEHVVFFVYNRKTGEYFGINDGEKVRPASVSKLALGVALYSLAEKGAISLEDRLEAKDALKPRNLTAWDSKDSYTIAEAIEHTIKGSGNYSANLLLDKYADQINAELRELGYAVEFNGMFLGQDIAPDANYTHNRVEGKSLAKMLTHLADGALLNSEHSSQVQEYLTPERNQFAPSGAREWVKIGNSDESLGMVSRMDDGVNDYVVGVIVSNSAAPLTRPDYKFATDHGRMVATQLFKLASGLQNVIQS